MISRGRRDGFPADADDCRRGEQEVHPLSLDAADYRQSDWGVLPPARRLRPELRSEK